jgi:hypothetical protein
MPVLSDDASALLMARLAPPRTRASLAGLLAATPSETDAWLAALVAANLVVIQTPAPYLGWTHW